MTATTNTREMLSIPQASSWPFLVIWTAAYALVTTIWVVAFAIIGDDPTTLLIPPLIGALLGIVQGVTWFAVRRYFAGCTPFHFGALLLLGTWILGGFMGAAFFRGTTVTEGAELQAYTVYGFAAAFQFIVIRRTHYYGYLWIIAHLTAVSVLGFTLALLATGPAWFAGLVGGLSHGLFLSGFMWWYLRNGVTPSRIQPKRKRTAQDATAPPEDTKDE